MRTIEKDIKFKITMAVIGVVAVYFFLFNGAAQGGMFLLGVSIGFLSNMVRSKSNQHFLINKDLNAASFIILYFLRIIIPVVAGAMALSLSMSIGIVFLLGFTTQFAYIVKNVSKEREPVKE